LSTRGWARAASPSDARCRPLESQLAPLAPRRGSSRWSCSCLARGRDAPASCLHSRTDPFPLVSLPPSTPFVFRARRAGAHRAPCENPVVLPSPLRSLVNMHAAAAPLATLKYPSQVTSAYRTIPDTTPCDRRHHALLQHGPRLPRSSDRTCRTLNRHTAPTPLVSLCDSFVQSLF
jgi:hypothetical protein